jgi:hypothetical protein
MVAFLGAARAAAIASAAIAVFCGAATAQGAAPETAIAETPLQSLPQQALSVGQCGMFVWSKNENPVLMMVAYDNPAEAVVRTDGRERRLERTAFDGERQHGHFETQTFSNGRITLTLEVRLTPQGNMRDGALIEAGVVRMRDRRGWETVVPVGGLLACQR